MHELGVVFHIIDSLEEVAKENDVTQIQSVTIEIGEVSTVIPHYLTDCWEWAIKKKPMLTGCAMKVEILPAITWCDGCKQEYPTVQHGRICPYCGSEAIYGTGNGYKCAECGRYISNPDDLNLNYEEGYYESLVITLGSVISL